MLFLSKLLPFLDTPNWYETPEQQSSFMSGVMFTAGALSLVWLIKKLTNYRRYMPKAWTDSELAGQPAILAVETALPPYTWREEDSIRLLETAKNHPEIEAKPETIEFHMKRLLGNGIDTRHLCIEADSLEKRKGLYGSCKVIGNPDAEERHAHWAEWAPKLATEAAQKAIRKWGGGKDRITHVIFHSCTGFKAPGVELDVVDNLGLPNVRRRLAINYMGCFGGFTALSVAKSYALAEPGAVVLLVCVEICSAHITQSDERGKALGNTLFSDGAAAVIVGPGGVGDWAIGHQATNTLAKLSRGYMTWKPTCSSYEMFLDKKIGEVFGIELYFNMKRYFYQVVGEAGRPSDVEWCVHPGGRKILDSFAERLGMGIEKKTMRHSYEVLRTCGNMSSPTIFFVIKSMMEEAKQENSITKDTAFCLGFGPGLTMETAALHRIKATSKSTEGVSA
jgi:predicted naringenin-chalcone synthase